MIFFFMIFLALVISLILLVKLQYPTKMCDESNEKIIDAMIIPD